MSGVSMVFLPSMTNYVVSNYLTFRNVKIIGKLIDGCQQLLDGKTEGDAPYQWHNEDLSGISKQHHYDKDDPELVIVYRDDKIDP